MPHDLGGDSHVSQYGPVDSLLDLGQFLGRHGSNMAEVKAQALGRNQRALLVHMGAKDRTQGSVQKVRCRVVACRCQAVLLVNCEHDLAVQEQRALCHLNHMHIERGLGPDRIEDPGLHAGFLVGHGAGIACLAAAFPVEGRHVGNHVAFFALLKGGDAHPFLIKQCHDPALCRQGVIAHKAAFHAVFGQPGKYGAAVVCALSQKAALFQAFLGPGTLGCHKCVKAVFIDSKALLKADIAHDIQGEAVGVGQLEADLAWNGLLALGLQFLNFAFKQAEALGQGT